MANHDAEDVEVIKARAGLDALKALGTPVQSITATAALRPGHWLAKRCDGCGAGHLYCSPEDLALARALWPEVQPQTPDNKALMEVAAAAQYLVKPS